MKVGLVGYAGSGKSTVVRRLLSDLGPTNVAVLEQDAYYRDAPDLSLAEREGGHYLVLSGPMASCAWSGYGHVSIAAAALQMLTRALREEAKELPVVVQQLQVGRPVRSETNRDCACPDWIGADEVARRAIELLERRDTQVPLVEIGAYAPRPAASVQGVRHEAN